MYKKIEGEQGGGVETKEGIFPNFLRPYTRCLLYRGWIKNHDPKLNVQNTKKTD